MPLYEFKHPKTGVVIEKYYKVGKCPETLKVKGKTYKRIFSLPAVMVDMDKPKTVGALAEKNTRQMAKEGKLAPKKKAPRPWWRPNKDKPNTVLLSKLNTAAKVEKYIRRGEA